MRFDQKTQNVDVLVVGAGVAGLSAATAAALSGKSVVLIEKSKTIGGTAAIANGSIWIPNNELASAKGLRCNSDDQVRFILSECWDCFDENAPWCGVTKATYERADRYVSYGRRVISDLMRERVQQFTQLDAIFRKYFFSARDSAATAKQALRSKKNLNDHELRHSASSSWDYHWENSFNTTPYGKHIWASIDLLVTSRFFGRGLWNHAGHIIKNITSIRSASSLVDQIAKLPTKFWGYGSGLILVERFRKHLLRQNVPILTSCELVAVNASGNHVESVDVRTVKGHTERWQVNGALILSSGCFSHQLYCKPANNTNAIQSACVAPANDGDAIKVLSNADVQVDRNPRPLLAQTVMQLAKDKQGVSHEPIFYLYGDSFFLVDRHGRRVMNEKLSYHDRAQYHLDNSDRKFLFLIFDQRFKERNWGMGISLPFDNRYLIRGKNELQLQQRINQELEAYDCESQLSEEFSSNLLLTKCKFNEYARNGEDLEFGRGKDAFDVLGFMKPDRDNNCPSRSMYPLQGTDLYACIYGLSAFSTHGGLICDADSLVLNRSGESWSNLYAVGSCAASFLNGYYPSHGMSIGTGLVFGYLAGLHATSNLGRLPE